MVVNYCNNSADEVASSPLSAGSVIGSSQTDPNASPTEECWLETPSTFKTISRHHLHSHLNQLGTSKQPAQVIIIGDSKVGKTALLVRFLTRRFIGQYRNNADMRYTYSMDSLASPHYHVAKCWETGNNQSSAALTGYSTFSLTHRRPFIVEFIDVSHSPFEEYLDTSEASFVVVYNICERSSFLTAKRLVWMIRKLKEPNRVPVLLVGNKKDLAETHRQVSEDEVEKLGRDCDVIVMETSAAADAPGVTTAFNRLLAETRNFIDENKPNSNPNHNHNPNPNPSKPSLTILSSLTQMFANRRKRRKPHTL